MEGGEHEADGMPGGAGGAAEGGAVGAGAAEGDATDAQGRSAPGLWFARLSPGRRIAVMVAVLVIVAAAIAVPLTVAGGGSNGGYPASVRANFLRACKTNASTSLCNCALQKIEGQVSFHQFASDEASYERTGKLPSYYRSVVLACLGR